MPITGETRFCGKVFALFATDDVAIDANTTTPHWDGDHPDYDHVLWVTNQSAGVAPFYGAAQRRRERASMRPLIFRIAS